MSAYIVVEVNIIKPERYEEYKSLATASIEKFGGKYIVRGGNSEIIEGDQPLHRIVILEFESMEQGLAWYHSEEYKEGRVLRNAITESRMYIVEGL